MQNEVIKTAIYHPDIIPDVLDSNLLEDEAKHKLQHVYSLYVKNKEMPDDDVLSHHFAFDFSTENISSTEMVFGYLHSFNVAKLANELDDRVWNTGADISIDEIRKLESDYLKSYGEKTESRYLISTVEDIAAIKQQIEEHEQTFVTTGFTSINKLTKGNTPSLTGGWRPGSLYSVMGLSGYGKSIFLSNFARDAWERGNNVLYVSTEMDEKQTYERILKSAYQARTLDEVLLKSQKSTFPASLIEVIKVHPNDTTTEDIQNIIDQLQWKPDILLIDYADELKSHEKSSSEYEAQGIIYAGLKKIGEVHNLPVITATQTNRAAEDGEHGGTKDWVGMGAIADSTKKIRLVDMLFSITQSINDKVGNTLNLIVLKNRFGQSNIKIPFTINYQTMRLNEMETSYTPLPSPDPEKEDAIDKPLTPPPVGPRLNRRGKI
jgi:archaellum biogenesis ATPase FlaH